MWVGPQYRSQLPSNVCDERPARADSRVRWDWSA